MYDVDGNGSIDLNEMTKIVTSIYKATDVYISGQTWSEHKAGYYSHTDVTGAAEQMLGPGQSERPEERALGIFQRMDVNNDGRITQVEFVRTCMNDQKLLHLLAPNSE